MDTLQAAADLFFKGLDALKAGDLEGAETCLLQAMALVPDRPSVLVNLSVVYTRQERLSEALALVDRALLTQDPPEPLHWLQKGIVLLKLERYDDALQSLGAAIAGDPSLAEAHANRGSALWKLGRGEEALASYDRAISLKPDYAEAHNNRGNLLKELGLLEEALASYGRAIALRPAYAEAHSNRGNVLRMLERLDDALASYDAAIRLNSRLADAHYNRGNALQQLGRAAEALASYDSAISLRPDHAEAHNNRGTVLRQLVRPAEAVESYDAAIRLKPEHAEAHYNRGNALRELDRFEEAVTSYDQAVDLRPRYPESHYNRGIALKELLRFDEALASFDEAVRLQPEDPDFRTNRSHLLLLMGRFAEGLPDYEMRTRRTEDASRTIAASQPLWLGREDLTGKTLLVYWEQGLGDTIQFARYVKRLSEMSARLLFSPQRQLRRLMSGLGAGIDIVDDADPDLRSDFKMPLLSAMLALGTEVHSIPSQVPYLAPQPDKVRLWRQALGTERPRLRVGICWQGSKNKIDHGRSFPLEELHAISRIPGISLLSLHKGEGESQLAGLPSGMRVDTLGPEFDSGPDAFIDTAAVISLCDLVITSDTAVAHLAGALGATTWVALKQVPDWRWLLNRSDSPWYPTMRLFRQKTAGDWRGVFAEMEVELRRLIGA